MVSSRTYLSTCSNYYIDGAKQKPLAPASITPTVYSLRLAQAPFQLVRPERGQYLAAIFGEVPTPTHEKASQLRGSLETVLGNELKV